MAKRVPEPDEADDTVRLGPWPKGLDNRRSDARVPRDALRNAVNVDVLEDGSVRRRDGVTLKISGDIHSLWSNTARNLMFAVVDGVLTQYAVSNAGVLSGTVIRSGLTGAAMAYLDAGLPDGSVYYSNGVVTGRVVGGINKPWGVQVPSGQPVVSPVAAGNLRAGLYHVAIDYLAGEEESGTPRTALVAVASDQGIQLSSIPQPSSPDVTGVRVYVSEANADVLYQNFDLAVGVTSAVVGATSTPGKVLDTQFMRPPPAGTVLAFYNGRIYIGVGDQLYFTEPFRLGAIREINYHQFAQEITIVHPVDDGLIVVADAHYFLRGPDPAVMELEVVLPHGAAKGTRVIPPDTDMAYWVSEEGVIEASRNGGLRNLTKDRVEIPEYLRGGGLFRESDGLKQMIFSLQDQGAASTLVAESYFDAEVIRKTP